MRMVLFGLALALAALPAHAQNFGPLDGTWEGRLVSIDGPGLSKINSFVVRVVIDGTSARVFLLPASGKVEEVMPGAFQVARLKSNAVVIALGSGTDEDGTWVETWDFALTQKDGSRLIANWVREVNNVDMPATTADSKFSVAATGELARAR